MKELTYRPFKRMAIKSGKVFQPSLTFDGILPLLKYILTEVEFGEMSDWAEKLSQI
jgi:hypothetical protein